MYARSLIILFIVRHAMPVLYVHSSALYAVFALAVKADYRFVVRPLRADRLSCIVSLCSPARYKINAGVAMRRVRWQVIASALLGFHVVPKGTEWVLKGYRMAAPPNIPTI